MALTDKNLYSYCDNNPVVRADSDGGFWHIVISAVVGGIIGGVAAAIGGGDVVDVIIGVTAGAAGGALAASGAGVVAQAIGNAGLAMASNAAQQINDIVNDETGTIKFNGFDMFLDGAIGFLFGALGGDGASHGNVAGIKSAWKQLWKRVSSGADKQKALEYFFKNAHRMGEDFVLDALRDSLTISSAGTAIITIKGKVYEIVL